MDPFSIAAIVSMIGSAGLQYYSQNQAIERQQQAAVEAQRRQLGMQNQATQVAAQHAAEYDPTTRQQNQQQVQQDLRQGYDKTIAQPQVTAQGIQVGSTVPAGAGGDDYSVAKAKEQAKSTASLHALAGLMSRIGSAGKLRRNEAVDFADASGAIGRINTGANNINKIDQTGIQAAGTPNFLAQIASKALGAYGMNQIAMSGLTPDTSQLATGDFARMDRAGSWLKPQ